MATDDLNQENIDGVIAAARATEKDFDEEYEAAMKALKARNREREADLKAIDTARAVVDERHAHQAKPLLEKLDEYERIDKLRNGTPEPEPESQTPAEPEPTPVPQPAAPSDGDHTSVDLPAVQPAPSKGSDSDLHYLNPRNWGGRAWLLAIIGAVIGIVLARVTYDPMWSHVHHGWHIVLVILWFVVLTVAGFFTGGWIGANQEEQHNRRQA